MQIKSNKVRVTYKVNTWLAWTNYSIGKYFSILIGYLELFCLTSEQIFMPYFDAQKVKKIFGSKNKIQDF